MIHRILLTLCFMAGSVNAQQDVQNEPRVLPPVAVGHAGISELTDATDSPQFCFEIRLVSAPEFIVRPLRLASPALSPPVVDSDPFEGWKTLNPGQSLLLHKTESRIENSAETEINQVTDDQVREFVQAAQGHVRANILFAPKVTVFDRQTAQIADAAKVLFLADDTRPGFAKTVEAVEGVRFIVRPTLLDDGRVQADVKIKMCSLPNRHDIPVADDGTLLRAPEQVCTSIEYSAIMKADILHTAILPPSVAVTPERSEKRVTLASRIVGSTKNKENEPTQIVWLVSMRRISTTEDERSPELEPATP